ncbi:ATP-binding protein [Saccharothrix luteola]|uniref:ATP-binding protein n=1 Tax=Saccharothrix luteola TaxID=2893018 RepID=UPI001E3B188D|nr:SbcC/MukB-like Walker B domain-containing protein [Saccharothrix luteola]MCC8251194.1 hypothetical protein [Saccharothrix luteola]
MTEEMTLELGDLRADIRPRPGPTAAPSIAPASAKDVVPGAPADSARSSTATGPAPAPATRASDARRETAPATVQHRLESIQLVNWGGFEGRRLIEFDRDSTLMSGASGTGKSTIQDAWLALMQPSDTPFNGASNDAVRGRARSAEQRNLLSYLRGQTDTTEDADGADKPKVLRGDGTDTWGAVAATFVDDRGRRFTAFRLYYAAARVTRFADVLSRMFTFDGTLDLADLAPLTTTRPSPFAPAQVKARIPGAVHHERYSTFSQQLFTRLGIGAGGDGSKALRLLARVQAGQQIRTVDELYKEMVLERPATYDDADRAIEHFNALEDAYLTMHTEQLKAETLAPVKAWYDELCQARDRIGAIDGFGLDLGADSPVALWASRTEDALLTAAVDTNRKQRDHAEKALATAQLARAEQERALTQAQADHDAAGGGTLRRIDDDLQVETARRNERDQRRTVLARDTVALSGHLPGGLDSAVDYQALREAATALVDAADSTAVELQQRRDRILQKRQFPLLQRRTELRTERASYEGRSGRVPPWLDALRVQVAQAAGLAAEELPFLAELIDVVDGQQQWRTAIETVLGASARLLLVPGDRLEDFSRKIDPLHLTGRITFEGVTLQPWNPTRIAAADSQRIAGKLQFKATPFTSWVFEHVSDASLNALCVPTAADLAGHGYRVTPAGQTRRGRRGSHGRADRHNIIGFSNTDTLADIDQELADIERDLRSTGQAVKAVEAEQGTLQRRIGACQAVARLSWDDIDVPGSDERIAALRRQRQAILDDNTRLQALQKHIEDLEGQVEQARNQVYGCQRHHKELNELWNQLVDRQDEVVGELQRLDREQRVVLTDEQTRELDRHFATVTADRDNILADFPKYLVALRRRLREQADVSGQRITQLTSLIEDRFVQFQHNWYDPKLGKTLDSYADYARLYDDIEATGLHTRRDQWRRRLTDWSGEDLVPLAHSMGDAIDEIERRLEPINAILGALPFGANANRLRIRMRRQRFEHVTTFRRELAQLSSTATTHLDDHALEQRFQDLQAFMDQIRTKDDPRGLRATPGRGGTTKTGAVERDRDQLLDVRKHVTVTAECYDQQTGQLVSTHSSLGGKSGGESQELIAFIVGAALRFRLGDELRDRPRFAPVFLDEGFIKADAEFAGRAVQAWRGLGFQLVIGAPLDKVTGLEPHMNALLVITKDTRTQRSFLHPVKVSFPR